MAWSVKAETLVAPPNGLRLSGQVQPPLTDLLSTEMRGHTVP
jgi:hypothetical protein